MTSTQCFWPGPIELRGLLPRRGYWCVLGLVFAFSIQAHARVENGWHTLPFGGATIGDTSDSLGYRESVVYVRNSFSDSHRDNMVFRTREGVVFVDAPRPKYPRGASRLKGRTVLRLKIDRKTGRIFSVAVIESTGQAALDQAAVDGLKKWRTRPGAKAASVDVSVVFAGP